MKILIISEMHSSNIGDQAIFRGLNNHLVSLKHEVSSLDLSCNRTIHREISIENKLGLKYRVRKCKILYTPLNIIRRVSRHLRYLKIWMKIFRKQDLVIVGGGSLLINNSYSFPISLLFVKLCAYLAKKDYYVLGCSMSNNYTRLSQYMLHQFLKSSQKIYLRDSLSVGYLKDIYKQKGVISSDLALLLENDYQTSTKMKIIALNIIEFNGHQTLENKDFQVNYYKLMQELIALLQIDNVEVKLFTTGGNGDYQNTMKLMEGIVCDIEVFHPDSLESLLEFLRKCDGVVTTRLHSAILAFVTLTPFVSISWDNKINGFLKDVNMSSSCFDVMDRAENILFRLKGMMQSSDNMKKEKNQKKDLLIQHISEIIDIQ